MILPRAANLYLYFIWYEITSPLVDSAIRTKTATEFFFIICEQKSGLDTGNILFEIGIVHKFSVYLVFTVIQCDKYGTPDNTSARDHPRLAAVRLLQTPQEVPRRSHQDPLHRPGL